MAQQKKFKKKPIGDLVRCLRCNRTSRIEHVAQCAHCRSYAVKLITKGTRQ